MKRAIVVALVVVAVAAGFFHGRRDQDRPVPAPSSAAVELVGATLLDGLGDYSFPVTTSNPEAQRWFNQALMLTFGFNHDAAERSYLKATQLDPDCAMCWWGAALVLGPHVNAAMDPADNPKAWQSLQRAVALAPKLGRGERRSSRRCSALRRRSRRRIVDALDEAYAKATGALVASTLTTSTQRSSTPRP